ncbi:MAG: hypothetical protein Q9M36_02225 [Sulfurovum sp.]|nr:hypothetical protein [Sulfurovum sp.]
MFGMVDNREKTLVKVAGMRISRPDAENIATDLGITFNDVTVDNHILTIYITSDECREIIKDNALLVFIAMALEKPIEDITAG